jgi:hypothetical protein
MAVVKQQTQNLHEFSSELHMTWKLCITEFKTQMVVVRPERYAELAGMQGQAPS